MPQTGGAETASTTTVELVHGDCHMYPSELPFGSELVYATALPARGASRGAGTGTIVGMPTTRRYSGCSRVCPCGEGVGYPSELYDCHMEFITQLGAWEYYYEHGGWYNLMNAVDATADYYACMMG